MVTLLRGLLLLVLGGPPSEAAPVALPGVGPEVGRYAFEGWSTREGLPQASVTDLAQGARGNLHATTFGGAARFDGQRFTVLDPTVHTLPSIRFTAVAAAEDGRIAFGTQFGDVIEQVGDAVRPLPPTRIRAQVHALAHAAGALWAGVGDELLHLGADGRRWAHLPHQANALAVEGAVVWVAGDDGLARVAGGALDPVALPFGGSMGAVHVDGSGHVWVAGEQGVAVRPAGADTTFLALLRTASPDPAPLSAEIAVDPAGRVWLAHTRGLELLGRAEALIAAASAGIEPEPVARWAIAGVRRLRVDREGHLWVGTDTEGLLRVTPLPYERVPSPSPTRASIRVVERDGDRILAAPTCGGLWALTEGAPPEQLLPNQCIHALRATSRGILVGTGPAVVALDAPARPLARVGQDVVALAEDSDGALLVGTHGDGAYRLRGGELARIDAVPANGAVHALVRGPGGWWFGLADRLVVLRDDGRHAVLGPDDGLPRGEVRAILLEGQGAEAVAWIGTYGGGLARLTGLDGLWRDGGPRVSVQRLSERDGLPDNTVSALVADARGDLWGNGNRGLFELSRAALEAGLRGEAVSALGRRFPSPEGNGGAEPAWVRDAAGHLWFPTIDGLVRLDPDAVPVNQVPPEPVIEEVAVDGRRYPRAGGWSAPPGPRDTVIRFTAAVLGHPELARFRYRLLPLQTEWQHAGQREVRFANLPPDPYVFEVEAANEDGVWSAAPARIGFTLEARIVETRGYWLLAAGALASLVFTTLQWLRARNRALQGEIDGRIRTEAALRASEAHYRLVFEAASDGLVVSDAAGVVREANGAAVAMLGEPLLGRPAAALVARDPAGDRGIRADGTPFPARVVSAPLGDGRTLWSIADLTLRVALEERLAESRRLEDIGRLAGGIAHEFNNLLAVAQANADALRSALDSGTDPAAVRESVELIRAASARGAGLTAQLLAYGQRQLLRPQPVDLAHLVRRAEPMLRRLVPNAVELRAHADRPVVVLADPGQAEIALVSLVLAAAGDGADPRPIEVAVGCADGHGQLTVVSPRAVAGEDPAALLEPFAGSGGLGLAAVRGFAAQSQGSMEVRVGPRGGTAFELRLPAIPTDPTPPPAVSPPPPARGARILVCDDDPMVRRTVERLLTSHGFAVWSASGGASALEILEEVPVDLLLTDVLMPGMSGTELAAAARARRPGLGVVFVSGYTRQLDPAAFTDDPLVEKPFETGTLLAAVRKALGPVDPT